MNFARRAFPLFRLCPRAAALLGGSVVGVHTWTVHNIDVNTKRVQGSTPLGFLGAGRIAHAESAAMPAVEGHHTLVGAGGGAASQQSSTGQDLVGRGTSGVGDVHNNDRKIIFAFDTTDASQFAFDWAVKHVFRATDQVLLLNVRPEPKTDEDNADFNDVVLSAVKQQEVERLNKLHTELSDAKAHKFEETCRQKGIPCRCVHAMGNPAVAIVDVSADQDADCIVLGTHDRGALGRLTIGGVPTYVVHNARCPVIVARKKSQDLNSAPSLKPTQHRTTPVRAPDGRVKSWNEIQNSRAKHKASHDGHWRDSESLWNLTRHGATRH